jgi:polyferredoxin
MHYRRGLIRYSTPNGLAKGLSATQMWRRVARPRVLIYTAVLSLVTLAVLGSLLTRAPFKVDVVRDRGTLARVVGYGTVENVYRLQIMNATEQPQVYRLRAEGLEGLQVVSLDRVEVAAASALWVPVRVQMPPAAIGPGSYPMAFRIEAGEGGGLQLLEKSAFVVPR